MGTIIDVLKSIPALVDLFKEVFAFIKKLSGDDPKGFIVKSGEAFSKLNSAKTDEEKASAAKAIRDLIRGI